MGSGTDDTQTRQVTMTLEEALAYALERHRAGDLDQAEALYELVLQRQPQRMEVVNYLGILKTQRGQLQEALALLRRVVEHAPASDGAWNNIGNVLLKLGRDEEASEAFTRSAELLETPHVLANLARVWRRLGQLDRSERLCRRALSLQADHGPAMHHLALALILQGRRADGVDAALKALDLLPQHERRDNVYLNLLLHAGDRAQAERLLRGWLARYPHSAYAAHQLAACTGQDVPERASDDYLEAVFDGFASSFDRTLARLGYRAPELVAGALKAVLPAPARQLDISDLGCGTGLCGPLLQPWARRLVGCDLSATMMAHARERGVYDELHKEELVAFLDARRGQFDVLVATDTFIYFGELGAAGLAMRRALRPGGHVGFSVEAMADDEPGDHVLRDSGRYAHAHDYVRRVVEASGLQLLAIVAGVLREESNKPVPGWVVTARRAA